MVHTCNPDHAVDGDLLLFIGGSDGVHYGCHGRRFARELFRAQSFYHSHMDERGRNRVRAKQGTFDDPTPAREFNRLYKISEHTLAWLLSQRI